MANEDARLREQIEYYRERAPEYDDWFYKRGRHDEGEPRRRQWQAETEHAHATLRSLGPVKEALELAAGTGIWTERLLRVADRVTAVDASPEALALARRRVRSDPRVAFEVADLFAYQPARRFDLISFTFWLSHIPPTRLPAFFALLRRSLRPGGVLFALDQLATADRHTGPGNRQERDLADGRTFESSSRSSNASPQLQAPVLRPSALPGRGNAPSSTHLDSEHRHAAVWRCGVGFSSLFDFAGGSCLSGAARTGTSPGAPRHTMARSGCNPKT